ncbi:hypothetical protein K0M31_014277 [Melipona bicolor]|uniref:Uncharacterized protein n=1 Tax=Melipona bicolor TaxID=60889 RepID=A0AA40G883_9HYME|nr:hypothetical protein K0M31_014277 [Melipona bicolor]
MSQLVGGSAQTSAIRSWAVRSPNLRTDTLRRRCPVRNRRFNASRLTRVGESERCKRGIEPGGSNLDSEHGRGSAIETGVRDPIPGDGTRRLSIQHAAPDAVPGRNNNFLKSDEIGPRGREWKRRGEGASHVTPFIGCLRAVSMRDTLSLNNAREQERHPSLSFLNVAIPRVPCCSK